MTDSESFASADQSLHSHGSSSSYYYSTETDDRSSVDVLPDEDPTILVNQPVSPGIMPTSNNAADEKKGEVVIGGVAKDTNAGPTPETRANFLSILTFWWATTLIVLGRKRPLEAKDLYKVPPSMEAGHMAQRAQALWAEELARTDGKPPSLRRVLWRLVSRQVIIIGIMKLLSDASLFAFPSLQQELLEFLADPTIGKGRGWWIASLFLIIPVFNSLLMAQFMYKALIMGMNIKSAIMAMIYTKTLQLSPAGRAATTSGQIVNLMAVDAEKINMVCQFGHFLYSGLLQIIVCIALLINLMGPSALSGVGVLLVLIPVQAILTIITFKAAVNVNLYTDRRVKAVNEVLQGIRVIKLYAWERSFMDMIRDIRALEIKELFKMNMIGAVTMMLLLITPALVSVVVVSVYSSVKHLLAPQIIFPALTYFSILRFPVSFYPIVLNTTVEALASVRRLEAFMLLSELPPHDEEAEKNKKKSGDKSAIVLNNAEFWWKDPNAPKQQLEIINEADAAKRAADRAKMMKGKGKGKGKGDGAPAAGAPGGAAPGGGGGAGGGDAAAAAAAAASAPKAVVMPALHDISLTVQRGELVAIVGPVGSGKSSLASALLGELVLKKGSFEMGGTIGYVPQQAWIQNATMRDNILFGKPFNEARYRRVVEACSLESDFAILPAGDMTEIGEKGINISGGQKQRVSLARAVYADCEVYVFDDPLSAVDSHVGKYIFENCITGPLLEHKTRVFVTNQLYFLGKVSRIVVLAQGRIAEIGSFAELIKSGSTFADLMKESGARVAGDEERIDPELLKKKDKAKAASALIGAKGAAALVGASGAATGDGVVGPANIVPARSVAAGHHNKDGGPKLENRTFTDKQVKTGMQLMTMEERTTGSVPAEVYYHYLRQAGGLAISLFALFVMFTVAEGSRVATDWWTSYWVKQETKAFYAQTEKPHPTSFYMGVYFGLTMSQALFYMVRGLLMAFGGVRASRVMHESLVRSVLRAPQSFFDQTPVGRIINRFSKDFDLVDKLLVRTFQQFISSIFTLLGTFCLIAIGNPWFLIPLAVMGVLYVEVLNYFRCTSRELKRIESISRSPIFTLFSESLTGLTTIRSYRMTKEFIAENYKRIDINNRANYATAFVNRWLSFRLEVFSALLTFFVAIYAVARRGHVDISMMGLSLTYAYSVSQFFMMIVRFFPDVENSMTSVERIAHYEVIPSEPPLIIQENRPPAQWPQNGRIELRNLMMRYRPDLPLVLRGITLDIRPQEKVGIVGRTGSGKSSTTLALFRMVEIEDESDILIDGVSIKAIGVEDLRKNLSIIPQDPVIFNGTVRRNIDPFGTRSDAELNKVIDKVNLTDMVKNLGGLEGEIAEGGENISVGQRQLICLARALIRNSKVLVLDEATASVDLETDLFIQRILRTEFSHCTMLTIAHRLHTIIDYDRILVLSDGVVAEFDSPANLLRSKDSIFHDMVKQLGEDTFDKLQEIAESGRKDIVDALVLDHHKKEGSKKESTKSTASAAAGVAASASASSQMSSSSAAAAAAGKGKSKSKMQSTSSTGSSYSSSSGYSSDDGSSYSSDSTQ